MIIHNRIIEEYFMTVKFFKIIFAAILSIGLIGQTNASLVVGDTLNDINFDTNGIRWEYVGSFNLSDGPRWNDADGSCVSFFLGCGFGDIAKTLNGIEAAELIFSTQLTSNEIFGLSTTTVNVNRLAFYDVKGDIVGTKKVDDFQNSDDTDGLYNSRGDHSAYITDHTSSNGFVNYVFKRAVVAVPEPSTLAVLAVALCFFGARRSKR